MQLLGRPLVLLAILAALVLMTSAIVFSQKGTSIVTRIKFPRGRTTTVEAVQSIAA